MKLILTLFLSLIVSQNLYSQNAFSDAILLARNKDQLLAKLNVILDSNIIVLNGILSGPQKRDLENLRRFLDNPWTDAIDGKLNFKIVLEIASIISDVHSVGEPQLQDELNKLQKEAEGITNQINVDIPAMVKAIESMITDDSTKIDTLKNKLSKAKNDNDSEKINSEITKLRDLISYNQKNKEEHTKLLEKLKKVRAEISEDITAKTLSKQKASSIQANLESFKNNFKSSEQTFNIFAEEKGKPTQDVKISQPFKISESLIIEAITSAIIDQVQSGIYNLLIDEIFEKEFSLKNGDTVRLKNELAVLFPKTIKEIDTLRKNENQSIIPKLNSLKRIFFEDLNDILTNITDDSNYSRSKSTLLLKFKEENKQEYNYLKFGVELINGLKNGFHPYDIFSLIIRHSDDFGDKFKEYLSYLRLIDVLQKNLRDITNSGSIWINFTRLEELNIDEGVQFSSASYFLGLIYQLDTNNFKILKTRFAPEGQFVPAMFKDFKKNLEDFVISLNTIEANIKSSMTDNTLSVQNYLNNIKSILSEVKKSNALASYVIATSDLDTFYTQITNVNKYLDYVIEIYKTIHEGSFTSILKNVLEIYTKQVSNNLEFKEKTEFIVQFSKYVNFFIDVTNATSQEDLNNAVNKAVDKWGGFARKRENDIVLSINSYPGIFLGSEKINNEPSVFWKNFDVGLTVPLGLNFQFFRSTSDESWFGLSRVAVFFQVFDLTSVANFRIHADSTSNLPETITFRQLLSPGGYLSFSLFRKIPLTFNIGASYTPELRSLVNDGKSIEKSKSLRFGLNVCYDVPLWHIF